MLNQSFREILKRPEDKFTFPEIAENKEHLPLDPHISRVLLGLKNEKQLFGMTKGNLI